MDAIGYSCLSWGDGSEICDRCIVTRQQIMSLQSTKTIGLDSPAAYKHLSFQHQEGPLPAIMRIKPNRTVEMRDKIEASFSMIIEQYAGCVLCAQNRKTIFHGTRKP
ncbi:hypothetical protein V1504DRAFT_465384 [Lipomyces starkeyi]